MDLTVERRNYELLKSKFWLETSNSSNNHFLKAALAFLLAA